MRVKFAPQVAGGKFLPFVNEMLDVTVEVRMEKVGGGVVFEGSSGHGGLEIESVEEGGIGLLTTPSPE